jgi:hypothetical protein
MTDPDHVLQGAHLNLRKVRFVTFEPGDAIPCAALARYTREAARLAAMSRNERLALELTQRPERSVESR